MKRRYRHILLAIEIGALVTAASAALAYFAHEAGAASISRALYWPNTLLQSLVSLHNIGSPEQPLYERAQWQCGLTCCSTRTRGKHRTLVTLLLPRAG